VFLDPPFGDADILARALPLAAPLVAADGWLYVESGSALDPSAEPALAGWAILRDAKAGAVFYHLLQRENEE
jgi:16S rRNA G966 N2-methylase RsmD